MRQLPSWIWGEPCRAGPVLWDRRFCRSSRPRSRTPFEDRPRALDVGVGDPRAPFGQPVAGDDHRFVVGRRRATRAPGARVPQSGCVRTMTCSPTARANCSGVSKGRSRPGARNLEGVAAARHADRGGRAAPRALASLPRPSRGRRRPARSTTTRSRPGRSSRSTSSRPSASTTGATASCSSSPIALTSLDRVPRLSSPSPSAESRSVGCPPTLHENHLTKFERRGRA